MKYAVIIKKQQREKCNRCVQTFPTRKYKMYKVEFRISHREKRFSNPIADAISNKTYIIHPPKYGPIMNSLITDSYLLSITRNPHISRAASRRAFAFAAPRIYSRSTRCANIQYRASPARPIRRSVSGRRIYLPVAQHPQPVW